MKKNCYGFAAAIPVFFFLAVVFMTPFAGLVRSFSTQHLSLQAITDKSSSHWTMTSNLINDSFLERLSSLRNAVINASPANRPFPAEYSCINKSPEAEIFDTNIEESLPPAIDFDFVRTIAQECPAVSEEELSQIILTTWKVCNEEKFHFIRALAQIRAESDFNPRLVSSAGARGLMQIMPKTGEFMGFSEVDSVENNIRCGVRYMKFVTRFTLHKGAREHWLASLASYNSGPGRYVEMARRAHKKYGSTKWNYVAKSYRRRFRRVSGQKLPETLIYINRNLYSLGRFQRNLFESAPLVNTKLAGMVRIPPTGPLIAKQTSEGSAAAD